MKKIRSNDEVVVITGKDKGKRGKVLRVLSDNKLLVAGVNLVKRHTKPNPRLNIAGGVLEKESSIHISNVAIFNPETGKADKVGISFEDGKKVRIFKSNKNKIA